MGKRDVKWVQWTMAAMLLLSVGCVFLLNLRTPAKKFSDTENRMLEQKPSFSLEHVLNGSFTSRYETYVSDQFAFRDFWIGVKSDADLALGKKDSNGVYLGQDGFLLQKFNEPADQDVNDRVNAINDFDKGTPKLRKYVMLVPTAFKVLSNKLPANATGGDEVKYMEYIEKSLAKDIHFIDMVPVLNARKDEYIFYKTDHHWTTRGAFYAYQMLVSQMGLSPATEISDFHVDKVTDQFLGSLYSKSGFRHVSPDSIEVYTPKNRDALQVEYADENRRTDSLYEMERLGQKDKYTIFMGGNHDLIHIATNHHTGRKLLIVKDSYANALVPFLTAHFDEIYVVDLRYYDGDLKKLVQGQQIGDMLLLYNVVTFFEDSSVLNLSEVMQ